MLDFTWRPAGSGASPPRGTRRTAGLNRQRHGGTDVWADRVRRRRGEGGQPAVSHVSTLIAGPGRGRRFPARAGVRAVAASTTLGLLWLTSCTAAVEGGP